MKTILLTILGMALVITVNAQNWTILNPEITSYYSHSDSTYLTNTINIDSVIVEGNEEMYYISDKYKVCDTCDFNPNNEIIIHRYAKEFLGFEVLYRADSNYFEIEGNVLKHQSNVGDQWAFNSDLIATVQSISQEEIIGELDSVKTVVLSSNDTILIGQNQGFIRYPDFENEGKYYELKGFHNNESYYGEVFPNFWSIYDFVVGDQYCYSYCYNGGEYPFSYNRQVEIISETDNENFDLSYEITVRGDTSNSIIVSYGSSTFLQTTTQIINTGIETREIGIKRCGNLEDLFGVREKYSDGELLNENVFQSYMGIGELGIPPKYNVARNYHSELFGYRKSVRIFHPLGDSLLITVGNNIASSEFFLDSGYFPYDFANHFGRLYFSFESGLFIVDSQLRGAIISGDTISDFCNFPFDLGIESHSINPLFIHPNPATSQIIIEGNYESLEIYSQTGQLVMNIEKPKEIIDVSKLPSGIYFLKATSEEKLYATKLIIE